MMEIIGVVAVALIILSCIVVAVSLLKHHIF